MENKIIIGANRSPIDLTRINEESLKLPIWGLVQSLSGLLKDDNCIWVSPGTLDEGKYLNERHMYHYNDNNYTFLLKKAISDPKTQKGHYDFSNEFLWFISHIDDNDLILNSKTFPEISFSYEKYDNYKMINRTFAQACVEVITSYEDPELLWIHDYHFALAPKMIRDYKTITKNAKIGMFWHIPFFGEAAYPLIEKLGIENVIRELLEGLLSNDLLGFHIKKYVDNFANAVKKYIGYAKIIPIKDGYEIYLADKKTTVKIFPIGIDIARVRKEIINKDYITEIGKEVSKIIEKLKSRGLKVFVGIERLDPTKGVFERLQALKVLWDRGYRFVYIGFSETGNRKNLKEYKDAESLILKEVEKINQEYSEKLGYKPILFYNNPIQNPDNFLLMRDADVGLFTSLADGMGLSPFEMPISQSLIPAEKRGIIVISNTMGAAEVLKKYSLNDGKVVVDPFDPIKFADKIEEALINKVHISDKMIDEISRERDVSLFRKKFLEELEKVSTGSY